VNEIRVLRLVLENEVVDEAEAQAVLELRHQDVRIMPNNLLNERHNKTALADGKSAERRRDSGNEVGNVMQKRWLRVEVNVSRSHSEDGFDQTVRRLRNVREPRSQKTIVLNEKLAKLREFEKKRKCRKKRRKRRRPAVPDHRDSREELGEMLQAAADETGLEELAQELAELVEIRAARKHQVHAPVGRLEKRVCRLLKSLRDRTGRDRREDLAEEWQRLEKELDLDVDRYVVKLGKKDGKCVDHRGRDSIRVHSIIRPIRSQFSMNDNADSDDQTSKLRQLPSAQLTDCQSCSPAGNHSSVTWPHHDKSEDNNL
jgi:hypothetical protein